MCHHPLSYMECLWQEYSEGPASGWDNRSNTFNLKLLNLRHKATMKAVGIDNWKIPERVKEDLQRTTIRMSGQGRFQRESWSSAAHKTGYGVHTTFPELSEVKEIHARRMESGKEFHRFQKNTLMDMYAKCGSMVDAHRIFESMPKRNVVSWNVMILGYAKQEEGILALELYAQMYQDGIQPSDRTFVAALKACSSLAALEEGEQVNGKFLKIACLERGRCINSEVVKMGFESDVYVGNILVDMYTKCGSMEDALHVFDVLPSRDVVSWTAMILGYAQMEEGALALELYAQMCQEDVIPNHITYVGALKACSRLAESEEKQAGNKIQCLDKGRCIHSQAVRGGFESDNLVVATLVDMYTKCGSMEDAHTVFDKVPQSNVASWNTLILGYVKQEEGALALELYGGMRQEGVQPSDQTFVAALKACSSLAELEKVEQVEGKYVKMGCLEKGRVIHSHVVGGLDSNVFVGNTLVDMYVKCGSMEDARFVFDKMPNRNVVSWTAMILGYAQKEESAQALELYVCMYQEGVIPNNQTLVAALKGCSSLSALEEGKQVNGKLVKNMCLEKGRLIHSQAMKGGSELDTFSGTILVDMYAKCGSMEDAHHVFEMMPHHDVVSWTVMISGYAQNEAGALALDLYARMQQEGAIPVDRTFVGALKACSSLAALEKGKQCDDNFLTVGCLEKGRVLHSQAVRSGFEADAFVGTMLVDMYVKCESVEDAWHVFDKLPHRDVVSWTAMITGYVQKEEAALALELYAQMHEEGIMPDHRTFVGALKACSSVAALKKGMEADLNFLNIRRLEMGRAIHSQAVKSEFELDVFVGTTLVDMYVSSGSMVDAWHVFGELPHDNVISWTAIISACAQMEEGMLALELYCQMYQEGVIPEHRTFVAVLKACSSLVGLERGKQVEGTSVKTLCLEKGRSIHSQVLKRIFESDVFIGNSLVDLYVKCGSMEDARQVFDELPHRNLVSWNTMILGYAGQEESEKAFNLHAQMLKQGLAANRATFASILKACSNAAALETGKELHSEVCCLGLETNASVATTLIDMYGKCGSMVDAQQLFETLPIKDYVTWNALIAGYARQGESEVVFHLFDRMREEGIQSNEVTFRSVLTVCSHMGLVEKGEKYFQAMSKEYGIIPTIEHYTCMIDLLSRAGHLKQAVAMVEKMPYQPDVLSWLAVLSACQKWKNAEVGRLAFEQVMRLDEKNSAAYVFMSNIYAHAH